MPPDPNGPPGDLDTNGRALYRKLRTFLQGQSTWEDSDRYIVGNTCRWEQIARIAYEGLPRDKRGRPIMTTQGRSENSGEVAHPLVRVMMDAYGKFSAGLAECGLTPRARKQLEIEVGAKGGGKFGGLS